MKIEQGKITYKDLGYSSTLSKQTLFAPKYIAYGDTASGDLAGTYPRPTIRWGATDARYLRYLGSFSTANEPTPETVSVYYNTDDAKLYFTEGTHWEQITSEIVPSSSVSPSLSPSSSVSPSPSV